MQNLFCENYMLYLKWSVGILWKKVLCSSVYSHFRIIFKIIFIINTIIFTQKDQFLNCITRCKSSVSNELFIYLCSQRKLGVVRCLQTIVIVQFLFVHV